MWALAWIADYPSPERLPGDPAGLGPAEQLRALVEPGLRRGDREAVGTTDAATTRAGYDAAERILADEVPVVPVSYGTSAALAREGLLGATTNGLGILRLAGLAWAGQ